MSQNRAKTGEGADCWTRTSSDDSTVRKYIKTHEPIHQTKGTATGRSFSEENVNTKEEKIAKDVETTVKKNRGYLNRISPKNPAVRPNQTFSDFPEEGNKKDFVEDRDLESDYNEDDDIFDDM